MIITQRARARVPDNNLHTRPDRAPAVFQKIPARTRIMTVAGDYKSPTVVLRSAGWRTYLTPFRVTRPKPVYVYCSYHGFSATPKESEKSRQTDFRNRIKRPRDDVSMNARFPKKLRSTSSKNDRDKYNIKNILINFKDISSALTVGKTNRLQTEIGEIWKHSYSQK